GEANRPSRSRDAVRGRPVGEGQLLPRSAQDRGADRERAADARRLGSVPHQLHQPGRRAAAGAGGSLRDTAGGRVHGPLSALSLRVAESGAQRGGHVRALYTMSSGKPSTPTVIGRFQVYSKTPGENAEGMVDSNYFIRGYAIHGYHEVPMYAASHGCLRIPIPDAPAVFGWVQT